MPQPWVIIGGSVLLPNVGGMLGGFITRSQIKDWFDKGTWKCLTIHGIPKITIILKMESQLYSPPEGELSAKPDGM